MSKTDDFRDATQKIMKPRSSKYLFDKDADKNYMSNMKNWLCVHATNYRPRRDKDGRLYIPTTGMATGYKYPRATVHFTLNQIVASHMGGNWDSQPIVVLAPYKDVVKMNGNPQDIASEDTYFIPNPETGLVLPASAHIVKPNNDTLFNIGDKISTYKTDHFTDEEIETILSLVNPGYREKYEKYDKCDFTEQEIQSLLQSEGELVQQQYKKSKNKHAFLHGLFEETRMVILTTFLREIVVRMTMEKMGYEYIFSHEDNISGAVAETARANGISGNSGNKGHSGSLENKFERASFAYIDVVEACETNDIEKIYEFCTEGWGSSEILTDLIVMDKSLNVYAQYKQTFQNVVEDMKRWIERDKDLSDQDPEMFYVPKEVLQKRLKEVKKLEQGGISAYNQYLDIVLQRNSARLQQKYDKAMEKLKQNPDYPLLKQMLTDLSRNGKRWHKDPFGKWAPEIDLLQDFSVPPHFKIEGMDL